MDDFKKNKSYGFVFNYEMKVVKAKGNNGNATHINKTNNYPSLKSLNTKLTTAYVVVS